MFSLHKLYFTFFWDFHWWNINYIDVMQGFVKDDSKEARGLIILRGKALSWVLSCLMIRRLFYPLSIIIACSLLPLCSGSLIPIFRELFSKWFLVFSLMQSREISMFRLFQYVTRQLISESNYLEKYQQFYAFWITVLSRIPLGHRDSVAF